jgi:hypothetical protein
MFLSETFRRVSRPDNFRRWNYDTMLGLNAAIRALFVDGLDITDPVVQRSLRKYWPGYSV